MDKSSLINHCFKKGFLLNKQLLEKENPNFLLSKIEPLSSSSLLVLNLDNLFFLENSFSFSEILEFDKKRTFYEKKRDPSYFSLLKKLQQKTTSSLKILSSYQITPKKYEPRDFTQIFLHRYKFLEALLRNRQELVNILSINKILNKTTKETVSLIGLVSEITFTKAGNLLFTIEDLTGQITVLISRNKSDLFTLAQQNLVPDEVIGLTGHYHHSYFLPESIVWPDIPVDKKFKKHPQEVYALFLSDIHVGSTNFLEEPFNKFIDWLNLRTGNSAQKDIAQKVRYLFIVGDLVDGVGIYPSQDKELSIKDIYQQYQTAAEFLKKIPSSIQIIICPGNHDATPLAEPQPVFNPKYAQPLFQLPNVTLVSNPSLINIAQTESFPGFDVLLYHGYSFDYYVNNLDYLRNAGGYSRADLLMKLLLKKRHLAPTFASTPYLPSSEDFLLIKKIPDFFVTGHIHYALIAHYRNITLISGSCWQSKTSFQEKVGHEPQPARVPLVNLKTRETKILKFI